ncbi:MAG: patatin-like phospholipase family protein [Hyphomonadaceae bacterium]
MARTLEQHLAADAGPKRILALDGGGVKGILTLGMLSVLEAELRQRARDDGLVLSDYYDLIGGTSTGAIIATGLALGLSVDALIDMYLALGPKVFGKTAGDGVFLQSKFDARKLRAALAPVLTTKTLGSDALQTGLAIHAKRIDTGAAWVLTNHPRSKFFDPPTDAFTIANKKYRLIDLVLASAAAPTFFDEVVIDIARDGREATQQGLFVDGAVSGNNNPSISLFMLALEPSYAFCWRAGADNLMMTSCGTGWRRPVVEAKAFHSLPPGMRGVHALRSMVFDTQLQGIAMMQAFSEPKKPWYVNAEVEDMRGACLTGAPLLDYQRMDVVLDRKLKPKSRRDPIPPMTKLEEMLGRELTVEALEALDLLANGKPDNMELLLEIGRKGGALYVDAAYPDPKFDLPEWR